MDAKLAISSHTREIHRTNQRGGRCLSVVDLLDRGTVDLELAAYLGASVLEGHSFLVGALPGGAGKTTVMGALLNFVPPEKELWPATEGIPGAHLTRRGARRCFVCHEIGPGPYYAYLWGKDVRDLFRLPSFGHMAVTNLHADDVDQAREIVCGGCGVPEAAFAAWPLLLFLELEADSGYEARRRVGTVWEGGEEPRLVYRFGGDAWSEASEPKLSSPGSRERVRQLLEELRSRDQRRIEEVRAAVLGLVS